MVLISFLCNVLTSLVPVNVSADESVKTTELSALPEISSMVAP